MKVLNRKWKTQKNDTYELFQLNWSEHLHLIIHHFNPQKNISVIAQLRDSNQITIEACEIKTEQVQEKTIYHAFFQIKDFAKEIHNIWDFYVINESQIRYRIKSYLFFEQLSSYYVKESHLSLMPYSTTYDNFSMKLTKPIFDVQFLTLSLEEMKLQFSMKVLSYKKITDWQLMIGNHVINKDDLVDSKGISFSEEQNHYLFYQFEFIYDLSLLSMFECLDEIQLLLIRLKFQDETTQEIPVTSPTLVRHKKVNFNSKQISLQLNNHHQAYLQIRKKTFEAQVSTVFSRNKIFEINGRLIGQDMPQQQVIDLILQNRENGNMFMKKVQLLNGNQFKIELLLDELIDNQMIKGIWDLYFLVNGIKIRLESTEDDIENKQKVIQIPQQMIGDEIDTYVYKIYYTLENEVSLLIRKYMTIKRMNKTIFFKDKIILEGDFFVEPPLQLLPKVIAGQLNVVGYYRRQYELPCQIKTEPTKKRYYSHFILEVPIIDSSDTEYERLKKDLLFTTLQLKMSIEDYPIRLTGVIDPKGVLEDTNRLIQFIKFRRSKTFEIIYRLMNQVLSINNKLVVYQSFHGKSYTDSPKAIYQKLLELDRSYKGVWVLDDIYTDVPENTIIVRPFTLPYYYYLAKAKYFVNNGNFPDFYEKREGTIHLQTWHGTPLKTLGYDIDPSSPSYLENNSPQLIRRNQRWDYLIGPNEYTSKILKRAFGFKKTMLDVGYPRNDILYNENQPDKIQQIKEKIGIDVNKKVILYAPTWRDSDFHGGQSQQPYELKFDLEHFKLHFGNQYVLLIRLHYRDASRLNLSLEDFMVINVSFYDDIQELYLISDVLITDYSSVMFDFANLKRPMIFYCYDYLKYKNKMRGFYFNFASLAPGPMVFDEDQLFEAIEYSDTLMNSYQKQFNQFYDKFCSWEDGDASLRVIKSVFDLD